MIYSYNTLGWYSTKSNRHYDNAGNLQVIHHFETNNVPSFQLIVDSTVTAASYEILDINDVQVATASITVENATSAAGNAYSRLIFAGATLSDNDDGFYSLKITYDTTNYIYSDVFCWETDLSEYVKINAQTWSIPATYSNVMIGEYELNMANSFKYLVYLEFDELIETFEISEEGNEKTYGNIPLYNSRNKIKEFQITGYNKTLDFLAGLRVLSTNGYITITYKGDSYLIYDIETPEKVAEYNTDMAIMSFKFKTKDYLQTKNAI